MSLSCTMWTCTGIIHSLVGVAIPELRQPLVRVVTEWNTVGTSINDRYEREAAVWFEMAGLLMMLQGWAWKDYIKATGREELPAWWGWSLTTMGAVGATIMPESGFWLVLAQGIRIVHRSSHLNGKIKK